MRLWVGNLPYATTSEHLANFFRSVGVLVASQVVRDRTTGWSKGYGFITFANNAAAARAIAYGKGRNFDGRVLRVDEARPGSEGNAHTGLFRELRWDPANDAETEAAFAADVFETRVNTDSNLIAALHCPPAIFQISNRVNDELLQRFARHPSDLRSSAVSPRLFEEIVAEIWRRFGFEVELTKATRDGGYDVVAVRRQLVQERFLIECKKPHEHRKIGVRPVRELYAVKVSEHATKAILATTSYFTRDAILLIDDHRWELEGSDFERISEWLRLCQIPQVPTG